MADQLRGFFFYKKEIATFAAQNQIVINYR